MRVSKSASLTFQLRTFICSLGNVMQCLISQPPCCFTMYLLSIYYESTIVLVTGQLKGIRWVFVLIKPQQRGKCKHSSLLTKVIYSKWQGRRRVRNVSKLLYPQQHTCSKYNSRREHTGGQGAQVSQSGQYISLILTIKSLQEETVSYLYLQGTEPGGPQMSVIMERQSELCTQATPLEHFNS